MADFDIKETVGRNRKQTDRRVEWEYEVDFSSMGDGTGLAATETAELCVLPKGYVHERLDVVLRTAEGEAATLDVGDAADVDGFMDGGNLNGSANAQVALAGTEAYAAGKYFHADTPVNLLCPAAANTINVAKARFTFVGYMSDTE